MGRMAMGADWGLTREGRCSIVILILDVEVPDRTIEGVLALG